MFARFIQQIFRSPRHESIEALYLALCAEARRPTYFRPPFEVPDSFDGRFELLVAIVQVALLRLGNRVDGGDAQFEVEQQQEARRRGQALFDRLFADLDRDLRESGFGDSAVPKQIQKMADSFFGRGAAYHPALAARDKQALAAALISNLYATSAPSAAAAPALADHLIVLTDALSAQSDHALLSGLYALPTPATFPQKDH